jgi:hypothetical protein
VEDDLLTNLLRKIISFPFFALFLLILISCSNVDDYNYLNYQSLKFSKNIKQVKTSIIISKEITNHPTSIGLLDKYIILIDNKADNIINIYNANSKKLIKSFGHIGQGPEDFFGAAQVIPINKEIFWIYDLSTCKIKKYNLNELLISNKELLQIIQLDTKNGFTYQVKIIKDKIYGLGTYFKGRMCVFDMKGHLIKNVGKIPIKFKKEILASTHSHAYQSSFVFNPVTNRICVATRFGTFIEYYDLNGKNVLTLQGPEKISPQYDVVPVKDYFSMSYNKNTRFGYIDICYSKKLNLTFLLYSGKYQFKDKLPNYGNNIYILDNKNKLMSCLKINKNLLKIIFSDEKAKLFGLTNDGEVICLNYDFN